MRLNRDFKKRISTGLVLLVLLALPIMALELNSSLSVKEEAGNEIINNFPNINKYPSTQAQANSLYKSEISAKDEDNDPITYTLECPSQTTDKNGLVHEHPECKNIAPFHPEGFQLNTDTGKLAWNVPADASKSEDIRIFISDGKDYIQHNYTLEIDKDSVRVQDFSTIPSSGNVAPGETIKFRAIVESTTGITKATAILKNSKEEEVKKFVWEYDTPQKQILLDSNSDPAFQYTPEIKENYQIDFDFETVQNPEDKSSGLLQRLIPVAYAEESYGFSSSNNTAPSFNEDPYQNNVINIGDFYQFTLSAEDADGDQITGTIITPDGSLNWKDWLNVRETSNEPGRIVFTGEGTPNDSGVYMVAITITDGLSKHYDTLVWPIVVQDTSENDTPEIDITSVTPERVYPNGYFTIRWTGSDKNLISKYTLFYSKTPTNKSTWKKITDLEYNYREYLWGPENIDPDNYFIVIQGCDNQSPSKCGIDVSSQVTVLPYPKETEEESNEEESHEEENQPEQEQPKEEEGEQSQQYPPQILNTRPAAGEEVSLPVTISADIDAGKNNKLIINSINLSLDDSDIEIVQNNATSNQANLNIKNDQTASISYIAKDLDVGEHRIQLSFKNNKDEIETKVWTFTVEDPVDDQEDEDKDDEDESKVTFFQKMRDLWVSLPLPLKLILGIGLAILILGVVLLLPLLFSSSSDTDYTYYIPEEPTEPEPSNNTNQQATETQDLAYNYTPSESTDQLNFEGTGTNQAQAQQTQVEQQPPESGEQTTSQENYKDASYFSSYNHDYQGEEIANQTENTQEVTPDNNQNKAQVATESEQPTKAQGPQASEENTKSETVNLTPNDDTSESETPAEVKQQQEKGEPIKPPPLTIPTQDPTHQKNQEDDDSGRYQPPPAV